MPHPSHRKRVGDGSGAVARGGAPKSLAKEEAALPAAVARRGSPSGGRPLLPVVATPPDFDVLSSEQTSQVARANVARVLSMLATMAISTAR